MIRPRVNTSGPSPSDFFFVGPLNAPRLRPGLTRTMRDHNQELAVRGLDPEARPLRPWKARKGRSDYSGRDYRTWNNQGVLSPFGEDSRRSDDFTAWEDRAGVRPDGGGLISYRFGWTHLSRGLPLLWARAGRNVLGLGTPGQKLARAFLGSVLKPFVWFGRGRNFPRAGADG